MICDQCLHKPVCSYHKNGDSDAAKALTECKDFLGWISTKEKLPDEQPRCEFSNHPNATASEFCVVTTGTFDCYDLDVRRTVNGQFNPYITPVTHWLKGLRLPYQIPGHKFMLLTNTQREVSAQCRDHCAGCRVRGLCTYSGFFTIKQTAKERG